MSSIHVDLPDPHAHWQHNNDRAIWVGNLIRDIRPDVVVNLGDTADLPSLSAFDKGKGRFQGRTYAADIAAANDFEEKLWGTVRAGKKKMPRRITLIGNHEFRIERAINTQPELAGTISYRDLHLESFYDDVVPYQGDTPGVIQVDGVCYSHYFVSGVLGRAIGGEHPASALLSKKHISCTQGHSHTFDYSVDTRADGKKLFGLVAGCCQDYDSDWAGECNRLWDRGVAVKRQVENGAYDLEWVSLKRLKAEYA